MGRTKSPLGGRSMLGLALLGVALWANEASAAPLPASRFGLAAARRAYAATRAAASGGKLSAEELLTAKLTSHPTATAEQLDSCTEQYFSSEIDHFTWCAPFRKRSTTRREKKIHRRGGILVVS